VERVAGDVKLRVRAGERVDAREWRVAWFVFVASTAAQGADEVVKGCGAAVSSS
jgi:hypothetical protein